MPRSLISLVFCVAPTAFLPASALQEEKPPLLIVSKRTGNAQIFLVNAKGQSARNLTQSKSENSYPAWSPDGKKIAFASDRDGATNIYVMDADGKNIKQLTTNANAFGSVYPSFSPDSKKIMWSDGDGDSLEVFVADADGKNAKKLTQLGGYNTFAIWSADGKSIVFQHMPDYENGPVYIMDADGGNRRVLLRDEKLVKGARPAWRPKQ